MTKKLLTKTCVLMLLAVYTAAWSITASAGIRIYVRTEGSAAGTAPYLYVWDNDGDLNGSWGSCQMSETTTTSDGLTWYVKEFSKTNINAIIHNNIGGSNNQTPNITGINEDRYYTYKGGSEYYNLTNQYVIPENATYQEGNFVYFVNTSEWETPCIWVYDNNDVNYNTNSNWPGDQLTKVANSVNLWAWKGTKSGNPTKIKFSNNGGSETAALDYYNGGYYHTGALITTITQMLLNSTNFPDPNFRAALAERFNVSEGDEIYPNNLIVLDVSNKGISNLTGIEHFTNLEELYAQNNSITSTSSSSNINVTSNTKLKILNASNNSSLTHIAGIANCHVLEELYLDGIDFWPGRQISTSTSANILSATNNPALKKLSLSNAGLQSSFTMPSFPALEYLNMSDNSQFNGFSGSLNLPKLKTLIFRNLNLASDALNSTHFTNAGGANLKYIDVSDNPRLYYLYITNKTGLETIIMKNCTAYDYGSFDHCPSLKHADFSGCTALTSDMWNHLKPEVHTQLQYLNLSNGTTSISGHTFSFTALDTLIVNNHSTITSLNIDTHCPSIIDITNDTHLTNLAITNCGLTTMPSVTDLSTATALTKVNLSDNLFTAVPSVGGNVTTLVMNSNQLSDINAPSNIHYLYAQNNNFGSGAYTLPQTSLVGLDLGNNGFTTFKAENNTSLLSLALAGNADLTEIELHGNGLTQTSPDGVIESDNGLYIKGLSSLQTLNIENSSFNKLGQQNSLEGVTGLKKLQARHNEFTTFTNGVYPVGVSGTGSYRIADPTESSLEHLTALEYLDLAYNNLQDSVHLYKNVALKHLDVSHNNHITGVYDGTITTDAQKQAMIEKKGRHLMKYGDVYQVVGTNPTPTNWENGYIDFQSKRSRPFDLRIEDLNDTTGLYHLDLGQNVNLEWLDFSYTNIHNTASKPEMMNTGWMDKDWVTDMGTWDAKSTTNIVHPRAYTSWHTYVYFIPCSKLKVIHADHNNMQSLGIRYFPELDTLTCSYMYGDCAYMRDFSSNRSLSLGTNAITDEQVLIGMGNISLSTTVQKLKSVTWTTDPDTGAPKSTLTWEGPDGSASSYYLNPIKHFDVSYSGYNEIRFYPGSNFSDLPNLRHINVSGNPLNCKVKHYDSSGVLHDYSTVSNYNSLDVTYCPNIRTVKAENCSDLPTVRAHNRTKLDTLFLSNDPKLKTLYVQNDPVLKTNFAGLNTLTGLETLFGYNNTHWGNDITFSSNTALKNLWVSNINASSIDVSQNTALEKLRAYDNALTTLSLSNNGELLWLDVARNKLPNIDLSGNTKLQFFNISNGSDTRTQLDGTETLNHDGSDGNDIKPTTVFSADEAPITSADNGNSLSDLALPASIIDARANGNDLHCITGNFTNLTNLEFAHNHVNGINLSAAPNATVDSRDNGRTIVADFATFKAKDNNNVVQEYKLYFFQIDPNETGNGTVLTDKESKDLKLASRHLGDDGLALDKIGGWDSDNSGVLKSGTTVTPSNMGTILDPSQIPGNIVVLVPEDVNETTNEASGRSTYTYTTGASSVENQGGSKFYLDWTSNGTVTGINIVDMPLDEVTISNTQGNLLVNGADGTIVGVYDLNGRQVASETITDGKAVITGLTPGIYVVNGVKVLVK